MGADVPHDGGVMGTHNTTTPPIHHPTHPPPHDPPHHPKNPPTTHHGEKEGS